MPFLLLSKVRRRPMGSEVPRAHLPCPPGAPRAVRARPAGRLGAGTAHER